MQWKERTPGGVAKSMQNQLGLTKSNILGSAVISLDEIGGSCMWSKLLTHIHPPSKSTMGHSVDKCSPKRVRKPTWPSAWNHLAGKNEWGPVQTYNIIQTSSDLVHSGPITIHYFLIHPWCPIYKMTMPNPHSEAWYSYVWWHPTRTLSIKWGCQTSCQIYITVVLIFAGAEITWISCVSQIYLILLQCLSSFSTGQGVAPLHFIEPVHSYCGIMYISALTIPVYIYIQNVYVYV